MNSTFEIKSVGSFAQVKGGKRLPSGHQFIDDASAYPYIRAQDIRGGSINKPGIFISRDTYDALARYRVKTGDVCLTIAGNSVGDIGYVDESLSGTTLTENAAKLTDLNGVRPKYLNYALRHPEVHASIKATAGGAAQPKLGLYKVKELLIPVPSIDVQDKIIEVLSPCDDLIAANQRRIQLLEESARLLYREWFVKLRFPGHETVPVLDGVPEGWEKKTLGEFVTLNYGKGLKETDRVDGDVPVYGSSGIVGHHNKHLISGPAIIVGRKGNVGSLYYSHCPCFPIDTVYFVSSDQTSYFLYLALQGLNFISSDSAVPGLNRNYAYSLQLTVPSSEIFLMFETRVQLFFEQINSLLIWNEKLRQARDLLLPRLMSGALDVSRIAVPREVEV